MYNKLFEQNKLFVIEVSNYCVNKCDGCIYTVAQRKDDFFMSLETFNNFLNFVDLYCCNKLVPHILLGTGEVLNDLTINYINAIENKFKNQNRTIEIATTGKVQDFKDIMDNILNTIDKNKTRIIIEFVLDGFEKNKESEELINKNIRYCNEHKIEIHSVLKTSINYTNNLDRIVENIKFYELEYITLDYVFLNNTKKILNFKDVSNFFFEFDKKLIEKTNIKLINYLEDYNYDGNYQYGNSGFYITKELLIDFIIEVPFGDLIINQLNSNFSLNINLYENQNLALNKINKMENIIFNSNKIFSTSIELCKNCMSNKTCCISLVKKLMDFNKIEFIDDCLGGKKILDYFFNEKNIKR